MLVILAVLTQIVGQITDASHRPVEGAQVTVGDQVTVTNAHGLYRVIVPDGGAYPVHVAEVSRIVTVDRGTVATFDATIDTGEIIVVHGEPPHPTTRLSVPGYSGAAIEHDVWARAWLLLDIDAAGRVRRVKFLKRPGYDLDEIAVSHVLALQFSSGPTVMLWTIEWPSHGWMIATRGVTGRLPLSIVDVPCRGTAPLNLDSVHAVYRDCTPPAIERAASEPWIDR